MPTIVTLVITNSNNDTNDNVFHSTNTIINNSANTSTNNDRSTPASAGSSRAPTRSARSDLYCIVH